MSRKYNMMLQIVCQAQGAGVPIARLPHLSLRNLHEINNTSRATERYIMQAVAAMRMKTEAVQSGHSPVRRTD